MAKKSKSTGKSFKELENLREKVEIKFEDKVIFEIQELDPERFLELVQIISDRKPEDIGEIKENIFTIDNIDVIAFVLKNTVKGDYTNFDGLSNEEIVTIFGRLSEVIIEQINDALKNLVINKLLKRIDNMYKLADSLKNIDGILENLSENNLGVTN
jgi:hypothetical protein